MSDTPGKRFSWRRIPARCARFSSVAVDLARQPEGDFGEDHDEGQGQNHHDDERGDRAVDVDEADLGGAMARMRKRL